VTTVPRLSIGLPVYNGQAYLAESLEALLDQSYRDFELIISDNASTDATEEICRRYMARDDRIRYIRQPANVGAAENHNVVVRHARGELFKWASDDDLYDRDLLLRCVQALDDHPDVVLASCLSAVIDSTGTIVEKATHHPEATDSPHAAERFRALLFALGGDDDYGIIRTEVLRRTPLTGSYYHSDRTLVAELALHGRFYRVPEILYYRREHPDRAGRPQQTVRSWCVTHDPRRADRLRHPTVRLLGEYVWAFADSIRRAPLSASDKIECYRALAEYLASRIVPRSLRRARRHAGTDARDSTARIGLFGLLGTGNLGNDGSLEALLDFLKAEHPDAELSCLCSGPERITDRYGLPATHLNWYSAEYRTAASVSSVAAKAAGKVVDAVRTLAWVRRQDIVLVPGMGVLEATLPLRPWGFPYSLLLLGLAGRLTGTKVGLVSVGADVVRTRATRWMITRAARLAHYRSYRDTLSLDAMREMGVDVATDKVYPDLAFALPVPPTTRGATGAVGVGLMAYHGGNDDRGRGDEIYRAYVDTMKGFVCQLIADGREVRLFTGDQVDESVVTEIVTDLRDQLPEPDRARLVAAPASTLHELMGQMATVDAVVATRYHNVLCALRLSKPTLSIGYAAKNDVLMGEMGLGEFCQSARSVDLERLVAQFRTLENRREHLVDVLEERNRIMVGRLDEQFAVLSAEVGRAAAR
jgi:polysaccharide pyruvyl transferase WcaK-like protein/glycosyltransferase involved in cell wall biosynthesis